MKNVNDIHEGYKIKAGYTVYYYDCVSSTNDVAKDFAKDERDRIVIVAETQRCGRGRLGRRWVSPRGGLWFTVVLRPPMGLHETARLTLLMSSAIAVALKDKFSLDVEVKWPNDVLINGRKACGILAEACIKEETVHFVILGVGINANTDLESFPSDIRGEMTTLKEELGYEMDRGRLMVRILGNFDERYKKLQLGEWQSLLKEWRDLAKFVGGYVKVESCGRVFSGLAQDVADDGALILKLEDGSLKKIAVGDVIVKDDLTP
jgi:BirA family biotin operon repressor/biotin-[acetyl-CoA-carboxylase] ligase